jgi:kynurenine/2-aminoadipate aminotransferase
VRLFYAIPVSANPTGVSWSAERRAAVYALASEFDFLLLEDDAYYYIQFDRTPGAPQRGLSGLGRSMLSLDTDGRVVRVDTFSKFLGPARCLPPPIPPIPAHPHSPCQGLRLGWITAPPDIHHRLTRYMQSSVQGAASISQVLVHRLLVTWGSVGLHRFLTGMQADYASRVDAMLRAARRHLGEAGELPAGAELAAAAAAAQRAGPDAPLAVWTAPSAGMFLWLRLTGCDDSEALQPALKDFKVAVVPGEYFHVGQARGPYLRLCFASASHEDIELGLERLGQLLRSLRAC